eukprot:g3153.t1
MSDSDNEHSSLSSFSSENYSDSSSSDSSVASDEDSRRSHSKIEKNASAPAEATRKRKRKRAKGKLRTRDEQPSRANAHRQHQRILQRLLATSRQQKASSSSSSVVTSFSSIPKYKPNKTPFYDLLFSEPTKLSYPMTIGYSGGLLFPQPETQLLTGASSSSLLSQSHAERSCPLLRTWDYGERLFPQSQSHLPSPSNSTTFQEEVSHTEDKRIPLRPPQSVASRKGDQLKLVQNTHQRPPHLYLRSHETGVFFHNAEGNIDHVAYVPFSDPTTVVLELLTPKKAKRRGQLKVSNLGVEQIVPLWNVPIEYNPIYSNNVTSVHDPSLIQYLIWRDRETWGIISVNTEKKKVKARVPLYLYNNRSSKSKYTETSRLLDLSVCQNTGVPYRTCRLATLDANGSAILYDVDASKRTLDTRSTKRNNTFQHLRQPSDGDDITTPPYHQKGWCEFGSNPNTLWIVRETDKRLHMIDWRVSPKNGSSISSPQNSSLLICADPVVSCFSVNHSYPFFSQGCCPSSSYTMLGLAGRSLVALYDERRLGNPVLEWHHQLRTPPTNMTFYKHNNNSSLASIHLYSMYDPHHSCLLDYSMQPAEIRNPGGGRVHEMGMDSDGIGMGGYGIGMGSYGKYIRAEGLPRYLEVAHPSEDRSVHIENMQTLCAFKRVPGLCSDMFLSIDGDGLLTYHSSMGLQQKSTVTTEKEQLTVKEQEKHKVKEKEKHKVKEQDEQLDGDLSSDEEASKETDNGSINDEKSMEQALAPPALPPIQHRSKIAQFYFPPCLMEELRRNTYFFKSCQSSELKILTCQERDAFFTNLIGAFEHYFETMTTMSSSSVCSSTRLSLSDFFTFRGHPSSSFKLFKRKGKSGKFLQEILKDGTVVIYDYKVLNDLVLKSWIDTRIVSIAWSLRLSKKQIEDRYFKPMETIGSCNNKTIHSIGSPSIGGSASIGASTSTEAMKGVTEHEENSSSTTSDVMRTPISTTTTTPSSKQQQHYVTAPSFISNNRYEKNRIYLKVEIVQTLCELIEEGSITLTSHTATSTSHGTTYFTLREVYKFVTDRCENKWSKANGGDFLTKVQLDVLKWWETPVNVFWILQILRTSKICAQKFDIIYVSPLHGDDESDILKLHKLSSSDHNKTHLRYLMGFGDGVYSKEETTTTTTMTSLSAIGGGRPERKASGSYQKSSRQSGPQKEKNQPIIIDTARKEREYSKSTIYREHQKARAKWNFVQKLVGAHNKHLNEKGCRCLYRYIRDINSVIGPCAKKECILGWDSLAIQRLVENQEEGGSEATTGPVIGFRHLINGNHSSKVNLSQVSMGDLDTLNKAWKMVS